MEYVCIVDLIDGGISGPSTPIPEANLDAAVEHVAESIANVDGSLILKGGAGEVSVYPSRRVAAVRFQPSSWVYGNA